MRYVGEQLAARWHAGVATLPGFVSVSFFGDDTSGECGYYSVWQTRAEADAVVDEIGPQLPDAARRYAATPPVVRIYEIYEPPA